MNPTKEFLYSTYTSKDTDELLSLYTAGTLTDEAILVLEHVLNERSVHLPKRPEHSFEETYKPRNHMSEFLHGKKSLKSTFWIICVLANIGLLLSVIIYVISLKPKVMAGPLIAYLAYDIFTFISVWRSSKRSKFRALKLSLLLVIVFPLTVYLQFITLALSAVMASGMR